MQATLSTCEDPRVSKGVAETDWIIFAYMRELKGSLRIQRYEGRRSVVACDRIPVVVHISRERSESVRDGRPDEA